MFLPACGARERPDEPVDPALADVIASIRAVDDHAHPMRPVPSGQAADTDFDALPLDGIPAFPIPARLELSNPEWSETARWLYEVAEGDTTTASLVAARDRIAAEQGLNAPTWLLDRLGTEVMLANRIAMGDGLPSPRFRWVAFADPLLFPLSTSAEMERTPDTRALYPKVASLLERYLRDLSLTRLPASLDAYVRDVVQATLRREHDLGAVAIKFEAAYLRPLDFDAADSLSAARIYGRYAGGGTPTHAEYKTLEDWLFRVIVREAGRLGMAVQIHVFDGFGGYYDTAGSAPQLLESVFDDPSLRDTRFVIVHGGWPQIGQTESMLSKPNVYTDISMMDLVLEPSRLAPVLRQWLGRWPDKVMFGSDAFDGGPDQSWALVAAFSTRTARTALGRALTAMMRDGEITRERAGTLARMVLRTNANAAYGLGLP